MRNHDRNLHPGPERYDGLASSRSMCVNVPQLSHGIRSRFMMTLRLKAWGLRTLRKLGVRGRQPDTGNPSLDIDHHMN